MSAAINGGYMHGAVIPLRVIDWNFDLFSKFSSYLFYYFIFLRKSCLYSKLEKRVDYSIGWLIFFITIYSAAKWTENKQLIMFANETYKPIILELIIIICCIALQFEKDEYIK